MSESDPKNLAVRQLFDALRCVYEVQNLMSEYRRSHQGEAYLSLETFGAAIDEAERLRGKLLERVDGWRRFPNEIEPPPSENREEWMYDALEYELWEPRLDDWWTSAPKASRAWAVSFDGQWWTRPSEIAAEAAASDGGVNCD